MSNSQDGPKPVWIHAEEVLIASSNTNDGTDAKRSSPSIKDLVPWVASFVEGYEAWDRIPPCWARHGAMAEELEAAWRLGLALAKEAGDDIDAQAHGQAEFWDYIGRMMDRLAASPGAACAASQGRHIEPATWDKEASAARRRAARQVANGYGPG